MVVWRPLLIRLLILIVPVFMVWKVTAEQLTAPAINHIHNLWVIPVYQDINAKLSYQSEHPQWQVITRLFKSDIKRQYNTYHPELKVKQFISISLGSLVGYTQGFSLLWLMILLLSKQKIKHLLLGSAVQPLLSKP